MQQNLTEQRRQLMRAKLSQRGLTSADPVTTPIRDAEGRSPLSAGQLRMWFRQTRDRDDTTLNICVGYRLTGALDGARLRRAIGEVVARHEILRTTYHLDETGAPQQIAHAEARFGWQEHDLSDLTAASGQRRAEVLARREFARPFDLAADSPLRVTLLRLEADDHVLLLVVHHICWDDESWEVFFTDLAAAYNGAVAEPLRRQFADVVERGEPDEADVRFWQELLTPAPELPALPGPHANSPAGPRSARAERRVVTLPADLVARVGEVARAHAATPFMVLLAGFQALVYRYTGTDDYVVSVPVSDRRGADIDRLIGYFGNTVLVRARLDRADTFESLLAATRTGCLDCFGHQNVGIDRVVRDLNPDRRSGLDGLEQLVGVSFAIRADTAGPALPGIESHALDWAASVAQEPLAVMIVLGADGARVEADYLLDAMAGPIVEQLLDGYVALLRHALQDPGRRIGDLDLLGDAGRAAALAASRGPQVDATPVTLTAMIEHRAAASADDVALVWDEAETSNTTRTLSYRDLNRQANRLAHWLIDAGVGPDTVVGLQLVGSVEFVVAALAVLKAGGAYLPIDPAYPADRISYLVADARPRLVLDANGVRDAQRQAAPLPESDPTDMDRIGPLRPGHLAYVIYTSGSTGAPKGVLVSHAAIADHLAGFTAEFGMTADDVLLQSSSVSFDASLLDIFVTLLVGARLAIPRPNALRDIGYVADLITRHQVTVLHLVPSMLNTLLLLPEVKQWRALRLVPVGGEALAGEVADKFAAAFDARLRNHYGPTEAVVCSTAYDVDGPQGTRIAPIGTPNRNVFTYLLDPGLQLTPPGVVGEIYLGGGQLARGYLGRPTLTAERFVADPFRPGERLYRTGDLARRNTDGEIEFVGRADEQIKIRGFRIELGEVEAAVSSHPDVAACVVVATEDPALGTTLTAYVVPTPGAAAAPEPIRLHAAASLPDYMVPTTVGLIDEIPLTAHGKLDRDALPQPTPVLATTSSREPRTPTEIRVAGLFTELFGRDRICADDSFFALGGHSLLAARLVTRIRAEFGIDIDVRVPFDSPTVEGIAVHIVKRIRDEFDIDIDAADLADAPTPAAGIRPALTHRERDGRLPLSFSQLAMWFQYRIDGPSTVGTIPFAARIDGPLDTAALADGIGDVVARHDALRTTFGERDGIPYQRVRPELAVTVAVLPTTVGQLDQELAEAARHPFDIESDILIRPCIFVLGPQHHVLSVVVHHLVADHASLQVLLADLIVAYRARLDGRRPHPTSLPITYADYAYWQREVFDHADPFGSGEIDYWRQALAGLPDEITVRPDKPRPAVLGKRGEVATVTVSAAVRAGLTELARELGATEFMVCQAAVAIMLHTLGAGTDIAIGTPVAGRTDPATADMIGLFADMVVLRTDLSGGPSSRTVVSRARDSALDAFSHQDVPIERLVEALNPRRTRARNPLFQVMLHLRDDAVRTELAHETTVAVLPVDFTTSFLDINIDVAPRADGSLDARVILNSDLYDPATAHLFAERLLAVLTTIACHPDRPIADLPSTPAHHQVDPATRPGAHTNSESASERSRSSSETERILIGLLEELLEIDDVDRTDGFFALGGDSVISIQWAARANQEGVPLTPQLVFEHFTIAELAAALDTADDAPAPDTHQHAPMSASGLDDNALAALSAAWQEGH